MSLGGGSVAGGGGVSSVAGDSGSGGEGDGGGAGDPTGSSGWPQLMQNLDPAVFDVPQAGQSIVITLPVGK